MRLKHFGATLKTLQTSVACTPLISALIPDRYGPYFPPLGDRTGAYRFFALCILGIVAYLPYFIPKSGNKWKWIVAAAFLASAIVSTYAYLRLELKYSVEITYPDGDIVAVTRGTDRQRALIKDGVPPKDNQLVICAHDVDQAVKFNSSKEAYNNYLSRLLFLLSDRDLIKCVGQTDTKLEKAYTNESIFRNRQKLYWSYMLALMFLQLTLGTIASSDRIHTSGR